MQNRDFPTQGPPPPNPGLLVYGGKDDYLCQDPPTFVKLSNFAKMGRASSKPVAKPPEPTLPRPRLTVECESPERRAFQAYFAVLAGASALLDPCWLADELYAKKLIGTDLQRAAHNHTLERRERIERLLSAVEDQIANVASPATTFKEFLDILQSEPSLQQLATRLEDTYCGFKSVLPSTSSYAMYLKSVYSKENMTNGHK